SRLLHYVPIPLRNASEKTIDRGRKRKSTRKQTAMPIRIQRTAADSVVAAVAGREVIGSFPARNVMAVAIFYASILCGTSSVVFSSRLPLHFCKRLMGNSR